MDRLIDCFLNTASSQDCYPIQHNTSTVFLRSLHRSGSPSDILCSAELTSEQAGGKLKVTYRSPLPPHWVDFRRRKEKKKKEAPNVCKSFSRTQNKSSQLLVCPLLFSGGSKSTNRYHKSPVLVSYGSRSKLRYNTGSPVNG